MTFIPLDTIKTKPLLERLKNLPPQESASSKPAIDVIQIESKDLLPAFQYACGSAIICDTFDVARRLCYDMNIGVKGKQSLLLEPTWRTDRQIGMSASV